MNRFRKIAEIGFICVCAAISLALIVNVALMTIGVKPMTDLSLGNAQVAEKYTGSFLPRYQNAVNRLRTMVSNQAQRQFPGYLAMLELDSAVSGALNGIAYSAFAEAPEDYVPFRVAGDETVYMRMDRERLFRCIDTPGKDASLANTLSLLGSTASRHPELDFYLYLVPTIQDMGMLGEANSALEKTANYIEQTMSDLSGDFEAGYLRCDTIGDFEKYFYRSDHHWNYAGAYQGYLDIIEMMGVKHPDIGEPVPAGERRVFCDNFLGSLSRKVASPYISDEVFDFSVRLPDYSVSIMDYNAVISEHETEFSDRAALLDGSGSYQKYNNYYATVFHDDFPMLIYDFGKTTGRNLLILGDSITNCMENLPASHFDLTYVVDLRHLSFFRFDEFVGENEITDVLFLYSSPVLFSFAQNFADKLEVGQ